MLVTHANQRDELDRKWELDGEDFMQRLHNLNRLELLALVDALERYATYHACDLDEHHVRLLVAALVGPFGDEAEESIAQEEGGGSRADH